MSLDHLSRQRSVSCGGQCVELAAPHVRRTRRGGALGCRFALFHQERKELGTGMLCVDVGISAQLVEVELSKEAARLGRGKRQLAGPALPLIRECVRRRRLHIHRLIRWSRHWRCPCTYGLWKGWWL